MVRSKHDAAPGTQGANHDSDHDHPDPGELVRSGHVSTRPVWCHGLVAGVTAAAASFVVALVADTAGVSFADRTGERIPLYGFPQLTLFATLVGIGLAALFGRRARRPRSTFVRTTVALTALSVVPDFTVGFDGGSTAVLVVTHFVAAAIVIPTLASRLDR